MKRLTFLFMLVFSGQFIMSQDRVLLQIDGNPVYLSEFERIYYKNNSIEGYETKTAEEYLEMFVNFKLKVLEAKKLGYDTLPAFLNELAGYREQLSRPYLQDRKLIDDLVKEAYYRTVNEVNASHVMVKVAANATPKDTAEAYNKAMSLRQRIIKGESLEKIAREESDDQSGKINSGNLGWFSAFVMVYPFENAAFNTKIGECSMPVKSKYGYHIIRVNDFRKSLGEIKLAHILVRANKNDNQENIINKREKINQCHQALKNGASFNDMVKQYSEDAAAAKNGGQMRWLRSGELPADIEKMVFDLTDSGSFTAPVQSEYGWHIFQLQGKRPIAPFEELKPSLEEKLMMDERGKKTEQAFIEMLKKDLAFISYPENLNDIVLLMDSSVYSGNWNPSGLLNMNKPLFKIADKVYLQKDLIGYMLKTRKYNPRDSYSTIIDRKFPEYINKELMSAEKNQLEAKYPAFRYLMEEYHDGILLFNIMDDKVWNKAASDTAGLVNFFNEHKGEYNWQERADVSLYTVKDPSLLKTTAKKARKRIPDKMSAKEFVRSLCPADSVPCVEVSDLKLEKDETHPMGGFEWKKGSVKTLGNKVLVVNAILPPSPKTFEETQGQVMADYQNYLDNQWVEALRAKYKVVVDQDLLKQVK